MIVPIILFIISLAGLAFVLSRGFLRLRAIPKEELPSRYNETRPFWGDFYELFVAPTIRVHQDRLRPTTYKEIEKLARRFRIIVLRIECLLLRFSEYIRGKRTMPAVGTNGHKPACNALRSNAGRSHYWEQLNNCKNGVNGNGNNRGNENHPDNPTS